MKNLDFGNDDFRNYMVDPYGVSNMFGPALIKQSIKEGRRLVATDIQGRLLKSKEELYSLIEANGGRLWYSQKDHSNVFVFDGKGFLGINITKKNLYAEVLYLDNSLEELSSKIEKEFVSDDKTSTIYAVIKTPEGLSYRLVGNEATPLVRDNYSEEHLKEYDRVVKAFQAGENIGRIVIMQGCPGGGKTHCVKGMVSELD